MSIFFLYFDSKLAYFSSISNGCPELQSVDSIFSIGISKASLITGFIGNIGLIKITVLYRFK